MSNNDNELGLPLVASGKVRDLYEVDSETLLFVASDRISAFDVIMANTVPGKGKILTLMTAHWFEFLKSQMPDLKTHFVSLDLPSTVPAAVRSQYKGRSMVVRKLKVFPIEAIVRGYITGSAWSSYKKTGRVNGVKIDAALQESQQFPVPLYTPSTKAELGQHDENISIEQAAEIVGSKYAKRIEALAIGIYTTARDYAAQKGIIIADTKFEFGLDEQTDEVVLIDEVLTPDSSRFWDAKSYKVGQGQASFDKQYLRDWLKANDLKDKQDVAMTEEVVRETKKKYEEAFRLITGKNIDDVA